MGSGVSGGAGLGPGHRRLGGAFANVFQSASQKAYCATLCTPLSVYVFTVNFQLCTRKPWLVCQNARRRETAKPTERIENFIVLIRDDEVRLDFDPAPLYDVSTTCLNHQVRGNRHRYFSDSAFELNWAELDALRS